jgi:hypothetical protein
VALVESAPGAVPVVFLDGLDGLDELVQASGRERADYLEEVRRFQQDTSDRGRPVTVIVTSRLSTVHRVRVPPEAVVARLEPFDPVHVRRWVDLWNRMSPGEPLLTPIWCSVTRSSSGSRCCSSSSPCTTVAQGCVT